MGMFNFPAVEGGAGAVTDVIGGGNGFAIGKMPNLKQSTLSST